MGGSRLLTHAVGGIEAIAISIGYIRVVTIFTRILSRRKNPLPFKDNDFLSYEDYRCLRIVILITPSVSASFVHVSVAVVRPGRSGGRKVDRSAIYATPEQRIKATVGYLGASYDVPSLVEKLLHQLASKQTIVVNVYDTTNISAPINMYGPNATDMAISRIAKVEDDYREMMELKVRAEAADVAKSQVKILPLSNTVLPSDFPSSSSCSIPLLLLVNILSYRSYGAIGRAVSVNCRKLANCCQLVATANLLFALFPAGLGGEDSFCHFGSSSKDRWFLDLNQEPQELAEVPAEEVPEPDLDPYNERDPDRIQAILHSQLLEKINVKENEIRGLLEGIVRKEIGKQRISSDHFDFRRLDKFFAEFIRDHSSPKKNPDDLRAKHELLAKLFTNLNRKREVFYEFQNIIAKTLLDFIRRENNNP
ncbi:hypothetical protein LguiA_036029 [Lonicera macranthoides]